MNKSGSNVQAFKHQMLKPFHWNNISNILVVARSDVRMTVSISRQAVYQKFKVGPLTRPNQTTLVKRRGKNDKSDKIDYAQLHTWQWESIPKDRLCPFLPNTSSWRWTRVLPKIRRCGTDQHCPSFLGNETSRAQTFDFKKVNIFSFNCETNLGGSSSSVSESRVIKERGPGGFLPTLFFSNENTFPFGLRQNFPWLFFLNENTLPLGLKTELV